MKKSLANTFIRGREKTMTDKENAIAMDGALPDNLVENWKKFLFEKCKSCLGKGGLEYEPGLVIYECDECKGSCESLANRSIDDLFNDGWLFPLQRKAEMLKMHELARSVKPQTLFEVGADKGGSVWAWCKALPTLRNVIVCEIRGTPCKELFEKAFPDINFLWLPQSSHAGATLEEVREWLDGRGNGVRPIDVLFLDGDKSFYDRDFDAYRPLMSDSGVVFFHDIVDNIPPRFHYELVKARGYVCERIIDFSDAEKALYHGDYATGAYGQFLRHWGKSSMGVGAVWMKEGLR